MSKSCLIAAMATLAAGITSPVLADSSDMLILRIRGVAVMPNEDAYVTPWTGSLEIDDAIVPELGATIFLTEEQTYMYGRFAVEASFSASEHSTVATSGLIDLGEVWTANPALMLQYHFGEIPWLMGIEPYIGAGGTYTMYFKENPPAGTTVEYEDVLGWALQGGIDFPLGNRVIFNVDVKRAFISTDMIINAGAATADVNLDPWTFGAGFGIRF